jgi:dihydropyrimidine dehydrogenase (NADP+)
MVHGYPLVKHLCGGLQAFMSKHGFNSIEDFRGAALPYFTTHTDLVARQKAAIAERKATKVGLASDTAWTGEDWAAGSVDYLLCVQDGAARQFIWSVMLLAR